MGDWLGTGKISVKDRKFRSFEDAKKFVQKQNIKSWKDWNKFSKSEKRPSDIPGNPPGFYKNSGWTNWGDFLGTGVIASFNRKFLSFKKARKFVHSLNLKDQEEWRNYSKSGKLPDNIPANPRGVYKDKGWISSGDWLGTGYVHPMHRKYASFAQAKKIIQKYKFTSQAELKKLKKAGKYPENVALDPVSYYKKDWISWGDFLGTNYVANQKRKYRSYEDARRFAHSLHFESESEWNNYAKSGKLPDDIPRNPKGVYKNRGWISSGDFLGTGIIAGSIRYKSYLPWPEAKIEYRKIAEKYGLKNREDWKIFTKTHDVPKNLPKKPWLIYTKERVWRKMKDG